MIELAAAIVIEGKSAILGGLQVVATDAGVDPGVSVATDKNWLKIAVCVFQVPDRACTGSVKNHMIELAAAIVIEGKSAILGGLQVVATDAGVDPGVSVATDKNWLKIAVC